MLSLKMKMESFHSLKWLEPMIPQNRGLMSGDGEGLRGRPCSISKENHCNLRSSPQSADQLQSGPWRGKVDLSSSHWWAFRSTYITDIVLCSCTVTSSFSDFFKVFAKALYTEIENDLVSCQSVFLNQEQVGLLTPLLWVCNWLSVHWLYHKATSHLKTLKWC